MDNCKLLYIGVLYLNSCLLWTETVHKLIPWYYILDIVCLPVRHSTKVVNDWRVISLNTHSVSFPKLMQRAAIEGRSTSIMDWSDKCVSHTVYYEYLCFMWWLKYVLKWFLFPQIWWSIINRSYDEYLCDIMFNEW